MIKAYAKINLGLNIYKENIPGTNKHKVETIMFLLDSIYDEIEIEVADKDNIVYYKDDEVIHCANCLILRVLEYLRSTFHIKNHYDIKIKKNIPFGAGLGGGSSDAGVVINEILRIEGIDKSLLDFHSVAVKLGSDIPFFITGYNMAYIECLGDKVKKLNFKPTFNLNVHLLDVNVNTHEVYTNYINSDKYDDSVKNDYKKIIDSLENNAFCLDVINNLQESCFELFPEIKDKYNELTKKHLFCVLSGSGSTLITIDSSISYCPKIRTRYAPSPTGYFHIGGARTAIFNYLFAKHNKGDFILRIEDTDIERNVEGGADSQIENLEWLDVKIDESFKNPNPKFGPYVQSEKLKKYETLAEQLVGQNKAYYCFCKKEELEKQREEQLANHQTPKYQKTCLKLTPHEINQKLKNKEEYVIRLKIDDDEVFSWHDLIRGDISVPASALTDPVILKANKIAMYNFAVVVDDYDMEITHVLRGEEHISNTPYQLAIAKALNKNMTINYGHLSIIVDETGKKLSKRNKDLKQFIQDYRDMGCIPEALFNFLGLLGFSPKSNKEKLSMQEFIDEFDINKVSKAPAFFDDKKLSWLANEYFKAQDEQEYLAFVKKFVEPELINLFDKQILDQVLLLFKNQISYAKDLNALIKEYFVDEHQISDEEKEILTTHTDVTKIFSDLIKETKEWSIENISSLVNKTKELSNKKGKDLFMPIRILTTKMPHGPELAKIIYLVGKDKVLHNIETSLK